MGAFSVVDVLAIVQVVGYLHVGSNDMERSLGFAMWQALQNKSVPEIRRLLLRYRYDVRSSQCTCKEH
jgi:hypothetical protein